MDQIKIFQIRNGRYKNGLDLKIWSTDCKFHGIKFCHFKINFVVGIVPGKVVKINFGCCGGSNSVLFVSNLCCELLAGGV